MDNNKTDKGYDWGKGLTILSTGLKVGATVGKGIDTIGYYDYLATKTVGDIKAKEFATRINNKAISTRASGEAAKIVDASKKITARQTNTFAHNNIDTSSNYLHQIAVDSAKQADKDIQAIMQIAQNEIDKNNLELKLAKVQAEADKKIYDIKKNQAMSSMVVDSAISIFDSVASYKLQNSKKLKS
jgi:hypothetical protein